MSILSSVKSHNDLLQLPSEQLPELCQEIRDFLIENVSKTGGHLASNLGAVELTVALHRVYNPTVDRILYDVGHQSYVHKILSGRADKFDTLRKLDGISGFPKPAESDADAFLAGHASDSVSVALGMARARTILKQDYDVVAVIGDGAFTGGLSYEGLNDAGGSYEPFVVVLNDNGMSINRNVGGISKMLQRARTRPSYINFKKNYRRVLKRYPRLYMAFHRVKEHVKQKLLPPGYFDSLGFYTIGPIDGHDVFSLEKTLRWAKDLREPVVVHVVTQKGKGYEDAEQHPEIYHGIGSFDPKVGYRPSGEQDFSAVFGEALTTLAKEDNTICAVTAAMEQGTGLESFAKEYPNRFFELGIAEEHCAAMCGGMAKQGLKPVFAVYSTFLQRSYDMLIEDVGLMNLHVVFAVDRAGIVGRDGVTHQGCFDVAFMKTVPGITIYAPSSFAELKTMLRRAVLEETGPVALRYPRGKEGSYVEDHGSDNATILQEGSDVSIVCHGICVNDALKAATLLQEKGISAEVVKINRICPLPEELVLKSLRKTGRMVSVEDCCHSGCVANQILAVAARNNISIRGVRQLDLGDGVVPHGSQEELHHRLQMDAEGIASATLEIVNG